MNKHTQFEKMVGIFIILILLVINSAPVIDGQLPVTDRSRDTQSRSDLINISGWMGENGWYRSGVVIMIHPPEGAGPVFYQINDEAWSMYSVPLCINSDGVYTFSVYFFDAQGNQSEIYTINFKIDKTPPVIHLIIEKVDFLHYLITLDGYDNTSGIAKIQIYIDDALISEMTIPSYEFTLDIRGVRNRVLEIVAIDAAGNNASAIHIFPYDVTCNSLYPCSIFHLQYALIVYWNANQTETPISNGETREVNVTVESMVTRGAMGKFLLRLLEGSSFIIHLSIENTPEWCEPWFTLENLSATVHSDEVDISETSLWIHVMEDAPGNYSEGWVKCRAWIESLTGPFHFFTLIHSFEQDFTVTFVNAP